MNKNHSLFHAKLKFDYSTDSAKYPNQGMKSDGSNVSGLNALSSNDILANPVIALKAAQSTWIAPWPIMVDNKIDLNEKGGFAFRACTKGFAKVNQMDLLSSAHYPRPLMIEYAVSFPSGIPMVSPILFGIRLGDQRIIISLYPLEGLLMSFKRNIMPADQDVWDKSAQGINRFFEEFYSGVMSDPNATTYPPLGLRLRSLNGSVCLGRFKIPYPAFANWMPRDYGKNVQSPDGSLPDIYSEPMVYLDISIPQGYVMGHVYFENEYNTVPPNASGFTYVTPHMAGFSEPGLSVIHRCIAGANFPSGNLNHALAEIMFSAASEGWIINDIQPNMFALTQTPTSAPKPQTLIDLSHSKVFDEFKIHLLSDEVEKVGLPNPPKGYEYFGSFRGVVLLTNGEKAFWPHEVFDAFKLDEEIDSLKKMLEATNATERFVISEIKGKIADREGELRKVNTLLRYSSEVGAALQTNSNMFRTDYDPS